MYIIIDGLHLLHDWQYKHTAISDSTCKLNLVWRIHHHHHLHLLHHLQNVCNVIQMLKIERYSCIVINVSESKQTSFLQVPFATRACMQFTCMVTKEPI